MTTSINDLIVAAPDTSCDVELAKGPWEFDTFPGYGPGASENDVIPEPVVRPGQLPAEYQRMSDDELHARIRAAKDDARQPARDPRPLLPARRGHPVRRLRR